MRGSWKFPKRWANFSPPEFSSRDFPFSLEYLEARALTLSLPLTVFFFFLGRAASQTRRRNRKIVFTKQNIFSCAHREIFFVSDFRLVLLPRFFVWLPILALVCEAFSLAITLIHDSQWKSASNQANRFRVLWPSSGKSKYKEGKETKLTEKERDCDSKNRILVRYQ